MSRLVALALIVAIPGCQTATSVMQGYVGKPVEEAILDYGPPSNVLDLNDGRRAYQWARDESYSVPIFSGYGATTTMTPIPVENNCVYTLITVDKGGVWTVDGYRQPTLDCN